MATPRIHQNVVVQARPDDVKRRLLEVAGTDGYMLLGETPEGFGLRRKRIPLWAILVAVFFFPLGLLMLFARVDEIVTVATERGSGGTHVTIVGRASVALQRALEYQVVAFQLAGAPAPRWVAPGAAVPPPPPPAPSRVAAALPPPPARVRDEAPPPAPAASRQDTPPSGTPVPVELPAAPVRVSLPVPMPTAAMTGSPGGVAPWIGPPGGAGATFGAPGPKSEHSAPLPQPLGPIGGPPGGSLPPPAAPLGGLPGGGFPGGEAPGGGAPGGLGPLDLPEIPRLDPRPPAAS
jgi:hypothetical protein